MSVSAEWRQKLAEQRSRASSRVTGAREVYGRLKGWIEKYRGGMPAGFAAAVVQWESGGKMSSAGDPRLGEVGYFQVTSSFPVKVGVDPAMRNYPEGNIFLGCLEYNWLVADLHRRYPYLIKLGTADSWKVARVAFSVGYPGTRKLIDASSAKPGQVYESICGYVDRVGGVPLGSQEAGKVWYRVHAADVAWGVGRSVKADIPNYPVAIPAPSGVTYEIEPATRTFMRDRRRLIVPGPIVAGLALAAGLGLSYWTITKIEE